MRYKAKWTVEAHQWLDTDENRTLFSRWFDGHDAVLVTQDSSILLPGEGIVDEGEWVIWEDLPDQPGKFVLMDDDNFSRLYNTAMQANHARYECKLVVEARRWQDTEDNRIEFSRWFARHDENFSMQGPAVALPAGDVVVGQPVDDAASEGEWVLYEDIPGQRGEFYSMDDESFSELYEAIP